ncbi:Ribonucleotide reductase transcriptional regulator CRT10 [Penicillium coprophilum]|uniref:Ribonucleotide reductase transcriptional regulator CRT10 n=1 Tax=Penicillium coprophilum TaxID=36646 RepID=UPI0023A320C8|nr:Ribonucleotide reductase transcriptional regulator CRT10 [Penicillium coprophilum]KAJ5173774.1 Ribonucleotide reductase transcriptional regulator CRT10 [Penicillium coprophilum]
MSSPLTEETGSTETEREISGYRPQVQILNVETEEERFPRWVPMLTQPEFIVTDHFRAVEMLLGQLCLLGGAALSQRRNLLFTAHVDNIYVWIPSGPRQLLGSRPEMVIHPVMKEPNAPGYIDRSRPHTINHIIVDDLGVDEVLLLATDSGNVTGYNVEAIFSAINRCAKYGGDRPFDTHEVKPFFVEHVHLSAWGLATHKFARLIAVSANTGVITVFAFALVDDGSESDDSSPGFSETSIMGDSDVLENTWVSIDSATSMEELKTDMPHHRTRNLRLSYRGHFDNIPCVSFANFELDPNGLWMVSTDIVNRVFVWRVWDCLTPVKTSNYDHSRDVREQRGWFVLPLHPRRVQQHRYKYDACGCEPRPKIMNGRMVFDVSDTVDDVVARSTLAAQKVDDEEHATVSSLLLPDDVLSSDCSVHTQSGPHPSSSGHGDTTPEASETLSPATTSDGIDISSSEVPQDHEMAPPRQSIRARRGITNLIEEENEQNGADCVVDVDALRCFVSHPCNPRFFPILHFSGNDITLDPYPLDHGSRTLSRSPLQSLVDDSMFSSCDRLNLIKYLPELGIVIVASQAGGVAIITLTWQEEIGHTFRLDWLLPFPTQEREDECPRPPLMGIAASPMPGFEIPPDVPCIPRDVNPSDRIRFNHRLLNPDKTEPCVANPPECGASSPCEPNICTEEPDLTIPETHAYASDTYQPHESWHGYHPSRHYRLLLLYCDSTVMSYEFWHDWRS